MKGDLESVLLVKSLSVVEDIGKKRVASTAQDEDGDTLFGKNVCKTLKDMQDKRTKDMVKLKIQQVLFEAKICTRTVWWQKREVHRCRQNHCHKQLSITRITNWIISFFFQFKLNVILFLDFGFTIHHQVKLTVIFFTNVKEIYKEILDIIYLLLLSFNIN